MSPNELGLTMRMEEIGAFKLDRINRIYAIAKSIRARRSNPAFAWEKKIR